MADMLRQGLEISALGLGLTFGALGILILTMILLERLFRPKPVIVEESALRVIENVSSNSAEEEIAAAIGIALVYWRSQAAQHADLGGRLEAGRGSWWSSARSRPKVRFASRSRKKNG